MRDLVADLEKRLRAVATLERAAGEKAYLKSDLDFLGATLWQIQAAVTEIPGLAGLGHGEVVALARELWLQPVFERWMAAVLVLDRRNDVLSVADLPLIERLVRESRTWALVDNLAGDVLGALVQRDPEAISPEIDRWASDADFGSGGRRSSPSCARFVREGRSSASCAVPTRCSRSASSSFARPSAGSCARRARSAPKRSHAGSRRARTARVA